MTVQEPEETGSPEIDRRSAVRRAVTVLGLGAGAVALPALTGQAGAKPGDSVNAGASANAGDAQTALKSSGTAATLRIENSRTTSGPAKDAVDLVAPQLQLGTAVPSAARPQVPDIRNLPAGAVSSAGGAVYVGAELGSDAIYPAQVHTAAVGNLLRPISPARGPVFDSFALDPTARAAYPAGSFDASGRVAEGSGSRVDLRGILDTHQYPTVAAVCVSVTVTGAEASGVVSAHVDGATAGDMPVCTYTVLPAGLTANGQPFALPMTSGGVLPLDAADRLWLSATTATHVRVHVSAAIVPDPACLVEPADIDPNLPPLQRRAALQRQALREMSAGLPPAK